MRELGFGLLLTAGLALGCGKYGPPLRSVQPQPAAAPGSAAPEAPAGESGPVQSPAADEPVPAEPPAEPPAP